VNYYEQTTRELAKAITSFKRDEDDDERLDALAPIASAVRALMNQVFPEHSLSSRIPERVVMLDLATATVDYLDREPDPDRVWALLPFVGALKLLLRPTLPDTRLGLELRLYAFSKSEDLNLSSEYSSRVNRLIDGLWDAQGTSRPRQRSRD
jgi:hypothetical protein